MAIEVERPWVKAGTARLRAQSRRRGMGRSGIAVLLLLLISSVAAGFLGYQRFVPVKAAVEPATTTVARRGAIAATVSLSGSTAAKSLAKLAFESAGLVTEIPVKVGESVTAGSVLAKLDTADLALQVAQAEATLEQSRSKLAQLKEGPKEVEVAAARASYESATTKYSDLKASPKPEDVAAAEAAVRDAETALANAQNNLVITQKSATVSKNVRDRENEHNYYETKYGDALARFKRGEVGQADVDREYSNLLTAKEKLDSARVEAELALRRAEADVAKAQDTVAKAKDSLQKLLAGPTADQLKTAEAAMLNAKAQRDNKAAGSSDTDVAAQEVAVRLTESALKQKQLLVKKAVLRAPFDGVIDSIGINAGEQVGASKEVMTLVNMKQFQINARVDETEVGRLKVGQSASVSLAALSDAQLKAAVTSIGATATVQQGVVNYPVILELQAGEAPVRPGMTASVVVEVARRDNALLVPNRAIRTQGRTRTVVVMANGQQETRAVTTGMSNEQSTEVLAGLQEGDAVVIPTTTTTAPRVPTSGFGGIPGGGPPGGNVFIMQR